MTFIITKSKHKINGIFQSTNEILRLLEYEFLSIAKLSYFYLIPNLFRRKISVMGTQQYYESTKNIFSWNIFYNTIQLYQKALHYCDEIRGFVENFQITENIYCFYRCYLTTKLSGQVYNSLPAKNIGNFIVFRTECFSGSKNVINNELPERIMSNRVVNSPFFK